MECVVCHEAFSEERRPVVLGCGHVFCAVCAPQLCTCCFCRTAVTTRTRLHEGPIDEFLRAAAVWAQVPALRGVTERYAAIQKRVAERRRERLDPLDPRVKRGRVRVALKTEGPQLLRAVVSHVLAAPLLMSLEPTIAACIREGRCVLTGGRLVRMVYRLALPPDTDYDLIAPPGNVENLKVLVERLRAIPGAARPKIDIFFGLGVDATVNNFDMDVARLYLTGTALMQGTGANQPVVPSTKRILILRKPGTGILRSPEMEADTCAEGMKTWQLRTTWRANPDQRDVRVAQGSATEIAFAMGLGAHARTAERVSKYRVLFEAAGYVVKTGLEDGGRLYPEHTHATDANAHAGSDLWAYLQLEGRINICYRVRQLPKSALADAAGRAQQKIEVTALVAAFPECGREEQQRPPGPAGMASAASFRLYDVTAAVGGTAMAALLEPRDQEDAMAPRGGTAIAAPIESDSEQEDAMVPRGGMAMAVPADLDSDSDSGSE